MASRYLSKSLFLRGLQCHKSLWLYKNRPELRSLPDDSQKALYDEGTELGLLAQQLFPGGIVIEYEGSTIPEKVKKTQDLIQSGTETIYEATFQYDDVLVMVDILHKGPKGWELYEVKASTGVKPAHENDVAVQYYVLKGCGLDMASANLVHINNKYVREGPLDVFELFTVANLTETTLQSQEWVREQLLAMRSGLTQGYPEIDIGPHCSDPYDCDFGEHCWSHVPCPSVFDLYRLNGSKKFELYYKGIVKFEDISKDFLLTETQDVQIRAELSGSEYIDRPGIREFLNTITYPLYFLDFETFNPGVPLFDGLRPYERNPFQYSVHFLEAKNGELKHKEFLAEEGKDPRKTLAERLVTDIPKDACVLAYSAGFEKGVISVLADQFPEHKERLMNIHQNIKDLIVPFRKRYWYKKEMNGSFSIKSVLPALIPDMSYENLDIGDGGQASSTYATLHLVEDVKERNKIRENLLEYCKMDTLAMVTILKKLQVVR